MSLSVPQNEAELTKHFHDQMHTVPAPPSSDQGHFYVQMYWLTLHPNGPHLPFFDLRQCCSEEILWINALDRFVHDKSDSPLCAPVGFGALAARVALFEVLGLNLPTVVDMVTADHPIASADEPYLEAASHALGMGGGFEDPLTTIGPGALRIVLEWELGISRKSLEHAVTLEQQFRASIEPQPDIVVFSNETQEDAQD